jgi:hypothetical protein
LHNEYSGVYLDADCDIEGDDEDGDGELVEDAEGAVHVSEDLLLGWILSISFAREYGLN